MSNVDLDNGQLVVTLAPKEGSIVETTSIILLVVVFAAVIIALLVYYFCIRETEEEASAVAGSSSLQTVKIGGSGGKARSSTRISSKAQSSQQGAGLRAVSSRQMGKQASKAVLSQASFRTPKQQHQQLPSPKGKAKSIHMQPPPPSMLDNRFGKMSSKILLDVDLDQPSKDDIDVKSYFDQVASKQHEKEDRSKQNKSRASNAKSKASNAKSKASKALSKTVAGGGSKSAAGKSAAGKGQLKTRSKTVVGHSSKLGKKTKSRAKK